MIGIDYYEAGPKTTLPRIWWPLMFVPSVKTQGRCAVCGRAGRTEAHHMVKRSAGELFDRNGRKLPKPTIDLCGFGNNLSDADGITYCHGLAHAGMLHFRALDTYGAKDECGPKCYGSRLEYLVTDQPTKYQDALEQDGWKPRG